MKKFRMMLPLLAVVFAVMGAVAGNLLPSINAYYKVTSTCSEDKKATEQSTCQINLPVTRPICTVLVGTSHVAAFLDENCAQQLRIPE